MSSKQNSAMKEFKSLHLAKNINELEKLANLEQGFKTLKSVKNLCGLLKIVYDTAQKDPLDQEKMFLLLTRYRALKKHLLHVCGHDSSFVDAICAGHNADMLYDSVRSSLTDRYTAAEVGHSHEKMDMPVDKKAIQKEKEVRVKIFEKTFISCKEMYSALAEDILIVDARPEVDYKVSRIKTVKNIINVPDGVIESGLSANRLGQSLPPASQEIWENRDKFKAIVILDWDTNSENYPSSKLEKLMTSIVAWDYNRRYNQEPVVLDGGYIEWVQQYPTMTTNPLVKYNKINSDLDELLSLDEIVYPKDTSEYQIQKRNIDQSDPEVEVAAATDVNTKLAEAKKQLDNQEKELVDYLAQPSNDLPKLKQLINAKNDTEVKIKDLSRLIEDSNEESVQSEPELHTPASTDVKFDNKWKDFSSLGKKNREKFESLLDEQMSNFLTKARAVKPKSGESVSAIEPSEPPKAADVVKEVSIPAVNRATKPKPSADIHTVTITMTLGLVGLKNIRNTCYMNTVLQCMRFVPLVRQFFCTDQCIKECKAKPDAILSVTVQLFRLMYETKEKFVVPRNFYDKLISINPTYGQGNHEDCMEFFLYFLNKLQEDTAYDIPHTSVMSPMQKAWVSQVNGKQSFFIDNFYHQIRIHQLCPTCKGYTLKFEAESTLMFSVPDTEWKLQDMMEEYLSTYVIEDYYCSQCKSTVINSKTICHTPKVLVVVLKRYKQVMRSGHVELVKNYNKVTFPKVGFKFGTSSYDLNAVAMHSGSLNCGHYTAACRVQNKWYEFNDETVTLMNIHDDSIRSKACAFFYSLRNEST